MLRASYAFSAKAGSQPLALWRSVRDELWRVRSLRPLLQVDVLALWHGQIVASDASEYGLGLVRRRLPADRVAELGRQSERWRYRVEGARVPVKEPFVTPTPRRLRFQALHRPHRLPPSARSPPWNS